MSYACNKTQELGALDRIANSIQPHRDPFAKTKPCAPPNIQR